MPKQLIDDSLWKNRIPAAEKYHESWENRFKCKVLEDYYEGFQYQGENPFQYYSLNKIYETLQIKLDQFIPTFPRFKINPRAGNSDYQQEAASLGAQMKEDALNTIASNPDIELVGEIRQAYKQSFFRFGLMEVGYAADWVTNPNASIPALNKDRKDVAEVNKPKQVKGEPAELPANERVFFKFIDASTFRVGGFDAPYLDRCGWYGYYEYFPKDDILALPGLMNRDKLEEYDNSSTTEWISKFSMTSGETDRAHDSFKIWKIWDNKNKVQLLVVDGSFITIFQRKFTRKSVFDYRPDLQVKDKSFYPIPPVFRWISPQDEINETREQLRAHRRRFNRKFQIIAGQATAEQIQKFETGPDGTLVEVNQRDAISAIADAPMGSALDKAIVTSADDLNQLSGTSSAYRGQADRTTATEAGIIDSKANIRENAEKDRVSFWLNRIGRETLLTIQDKFTLGMWIEITADPGEQLFQTYQENKTTFDWINSEQFKDGYDFKIDVDVTTLSTTSQQEEKKKFLEFLSIVAQFPQIALSPTLIRETAYRCGYRNEKVIKEMQQMALLQQAGMQAQIPGLQSPGIAQQMNNKTVPSTQDKIASQLQGQLTQ